MRNKLRIVAAGVLLSAGTPAWADCIQGTDGKTYVCGGTSQWNFESGKWTCRNSANGQEVSGERTECQRGGGLPDAGVDDDLLEPLVDNKRKRPIRPGDPRKRHEVPK
jgi:hypothetical protein